MTGSDDASWHAIGPSADLAVGDKRELSLTDGRLVLVMRTVEGVHACGADCPHQDTPLAEGSLDGTVLTCPMHYWQWDVRTGDAMGIAELPLTMFQVRETEGRLEILA